MNKLAWPTICRGAKLLGLTHGLASRERISWRSLGVLTRVTTTKTRVRGNKIPVHMFVYLQFDIQCWLLIYWESYLQTKWPLISLKRARTTIISFRSNIRTWQCTWSNGDKIVSPWGLSSPPILTHNNVVIITSDLCTVYMLIPLHASFKLQATFTSNATSNTPRRPCSNHSSIPYLSLSWTHLQF